MNIYESRYNNAKKVMNKINDLLEKGYRIIDDDDMIVEKVIENNDTISYIIKNNPNTLNNLFINDVDSDEGMHTNIKEFNKRFEKWTYLNPKHIKRLKL